MLKNFKNVKIINLKKLLETKATKNQNHTGLFNKQP